MKIIKQTPEQLILEVSRPFTIWLDQIVGWLMVGISIFLLGWLIYALINHESLTLQDILRNLIICCGFLPWGLSKTSDSYTTTCIFDKSENLVTIHHRKRGKDSTITFAISSLATIEVIRNGQNLSYFVNLVQKNNPNRIALTPSAVNTSRQLDVTIETLRQFLNLDE